MTIEWKKYEYLFLVAVLFGLFISLGNAADFANFPNKLTQISLIGIILMLVGLYGIVKAES